MKNLLQALREQGPWKRFIRNFFITRNAWGMFSKKSHWVFSSTDPNIRKPKVKYNTKGSAEKAAKAMWNKTGKYFSTYKCIFCDGYHIGRNRNNK